MGKMWMLLAIAICLASCEAKSSSNSNSIQFKCHRSTKVDSETDLKNALTNVNVTMIESDVKMIRSSETTTKPITSTASPETSTDQKPLPQTSTVSPETSTDPNPLPQTSTVSPETSTEQKSPSFKEKRHVYKRSAETCVPMVGQLTFQDYLKTLNQEKVKKVVKMNFESADALNKSLDWMLNGSDTKVDYPIIIHADIVAGPGINSTLFQPFLGIKNFARNAEKLLTTLKNVTISFGWETFWHGSEKESYTDDHIRQMVDTLTAHFEAIKDQPITISLRTVFAMKSKSQIENLHKQMIGAKFNKVTLSLWSPKVARRTAIETEEVIENIAALKEIMRIPFGTKVIHLDLPADILKELNINKGCEIEDKDIKDVTTPATTSSASFLVGIGFEKLVIGILFIILLHQFQK